MGRYFKPLRRRLGVVTLVMACIFGEAWVRSFTFSDGVWIRGGDKSLHMLFSMPNWCGWILVPCKQGRLPDKWPGFYGWHKTTLNPRFQADPFDGVHQHIVILTGGFNFHISREETNYHLIAPYRSIVLPLILLSAYLLLTKPRAKHPKPALEP